MTFSNYIFHAIFTFTDVFSSETVVHCILGRIFFSRNLYTQLRHSQSMALQFLYLIASIN